MEVGGEPVEGSASRRKEEKEKVKNGSWESTCASIRRVEKTIDDTRKKI